MASAWQRRRNPDEVPTPVAIAVSDFCRRAGAQASAAEVREALALLSEEEDFRVRTLTDGEPKSRPLGPFAVVDVLRGTDEALAATRQTSGYYEVVRELAQVRAERSPVPAAAPAPIPAQTAVPTAPAPTSPAAPANASSRKGKGPRPAPPSMSERIAPRKREPSAGTVPALEPARPRDAVSPKGRFATLSPSKLSVEELFTPSAARLLKDRVEQHPDRFALTRALAEQYGGRKEGQPLRTEDLERALEHHKLLEVLARKEREAVLGAFTEQRGAAGRVAWALGLSITELHKLIRSLGIASEVEQIKERFRREALSGKNLGARIDLLGRGKYLSDLGIRRRFDEALRADLKKLLEKHAPRARDLGDLFVLAARAEGTQAELLERAVERLELMKEVRKLVPEPAATPHAT
ncbi:MAG: hypothetical protein IRZ16_10105 [Myxococcaceae bacterium]|nr:hypothetical protein [Myxococcaceae bacterium]